MTRTRLAAVAGAALAVAALPAPALALTPVTPRTVLEESRIDSPQLAALPDGRAALGWTNGNNNGDTTLAMIRPAGGVLPGAPQVLRTGFAADDIDFLTGGPADAPLLTWFQDSDSRTPFAVRLQGDTFGAQSNVFSGMYGTGRFPRFARCPDGTTAFAYQFTNTNDYTITAEHRGSRGENIGQGSTTGAASGDYYQDPTPTCDRAATPLVAWNNDSNVGGPAVGHLYVRALSGGGGTFFDRTTASGTRGESPDARIAPDGRTWIVWREDTAGSIVTYVATRAPGSTSAISTASPTVLDPAGEAHTLFFSPDGATHVLVEHEDVSGDTSYGVRTAAPGSASFGPEEPLLAAGQHQARLLLGHPDGAPRLLVTSWDATSGHYAVQGIPQAASTEPLTDIGLTSSDWTANFTYLPSGDLLGVALDHAGSGKPYILKEGGLDTGAPPTLDHVSVPGAAVAGEATELGVDARDPLGLGTFSWTVDGRTLTDQDTSYAFTKPGTYTVTAKAVDRAGNASELTRTVRVLDPATGDGGTTGAGGTGAGAGVSGGEGGPAFAVADTAAPRLTAAARRGRRGATARTVAVTLRANEAAAADVELVGTLRRGRQKGTLVLRSKRIARLQAGKGATVKLAIPASLARLVGNRMTVRVTLTDLGGNRTQRALRITRVR